MTMLVHELLSRSASRSPDAVAVIEPAGTATYAELDRHARDVAATLEGAGIRRGERVVLALENSRAFVGCYFGILSAGAVVVPLPPGPRSDRLPHAVRDCSAAACIVDDATWPLVASGPVDASLRARFVMPRGTDPAAGPCGVLRDTPPGDVSRTPDTAPGGADTDLAAVIYTSGSTGEPRGVMLSHRNITANTASIVEYLALTASDRVMVVLPFYYVYGLSLLHTHVAVGGTLVIDNRFALPNVVLKSMQEHQVTGLAGVPSTFAMFLHRSTLKTTPLPSLRYVTQAGGPMPPARVREWLETVPDAPFFIMYGATEAAARLSYLPPDELARRPGSIGRAIPGVELRVMRDDGQWAAAGETGEIVARGENISPGYWNCPAETRERFGPEGFRTGDVGFADEDGYFYLVGRRHEMLKVGAHRISAKEIEEALHEHPAVHEAAVLAQPHDLLGEVPVAHVALRPDAHASAVEIIAFCRRRLPDHKVPARVEFHQQLPKSGAGKIAKALIGRPPETPKAV